jgi:hypothetical protein
MRLSPLEAYGTVMRFARDCGEWPLRLAMHASVAQSFRPVFLHLTKLNYLPEAAADPSVESDVLLAPFCREIGAGYYDFDPRVRALLLDNLQSEYADDARSRLRSVAAFLMSYLEAQERSIDSTQDRLSQTYIEVQRWIALSILDPDGAAQQLAAALNRSAGPGAAVARVQVGGLLNVLAAPLLRYPQLADYALGVQALERGEIARAQSLLSGAGELQVGPVKLRPARAVLAAWNVPAKGAEPEARAAHPEFASCFISWWGGEEERQFVHQLARDLRYAGVECSVDGEDFVSSPLAGRQVLVLVMSPSPMPIALSVLRHMREALRSETPRIEVSLRRRGDLPFGTSDMEVDFSESRNAGEPGYHHALDQLLDLLREQAGRQPKVAINPWVGKTFIWDVFISYSYRELAQHWVERFRDDLQTRLGKIGQTQTSISLAQGDSWSEATFKDLGASRIFVPLITPYYLRSKEWTMELDRFVKGAEQSGGLVYQRRSRIFPVFMGKPESREKLPDAIRDVQGITFSEFGRAGVTEDYLVGIDKLADALSSTLRLFGPAPPKPDIPREKTVYLSRATSDVQAVEESLRRELMSHGFQVLPEGRSPDTLEALSADLARSAISVDLVGLEGEIRPLAALQFEVRRGLSSVVWLKPGDDQNPIQRKWIARAERGDYPAEILRTSAGELNTQILDKLGWRDNQPLPPAGGRRIYIQVHPADLEAALPLLRYLTEQGFSVSPVSEGRLKSTGVYDEMPRPYEATILYWGSAPAGWVKTRGAETVKDWLPFGDRPPMRVYIGPPSDSSKNSFLGFPYFQVLRSPTTMDPTVLDSLIRELRPGAGIA